jgi:hypothetical protein
MMGETKKGGNMKNLILVASLILSVAVPVWACEVPVPDPTQQQQQQQGQKQFQDQGQGQGQNQNNDQVIAPSQNVVIEVSPRPLLNPPVLIPNIIPQLSFGEVKMVPPILTDARLKAYNGEMILGIMGQKRTTCGKAIRRTIDLVTDVNQKEDLRKCRIIFLSHPSTKMWSTGGNLSIGGANTVGTGGMSGGTGLFPSYGRMTADTIIDIIIVRVVNQMP